MNSIHNNTSAIFCLLIVLCGLFIINSSCQAINVSGYIVNEKSDTIHGTIQISRFDQVTGCLILNGIELESFYSRIVFKGEDDKHFRNYLPKMIHGYGFRHKSIDYIFRSFIVTRKSCIESENQQCQFMCLIYKGKYELYKYIDFVDNPSVAIPHERFLTYYNYFLYSKEKGLLKVEKNSQFRTLKDLMEQVEADNGFLQLIPEDIQFKYIKSLLVIYDRWLLCKKESE